ncbi:MBL fold metallo-hydrolase [Halorubrum sp. SP9]|uniref:MBL fold metallo-hydrolase n=1 Tax=Halorubrum sp. SP9 TaxID=1537267 RepID=UPI0010F70241|nr:MBL fold metallo-hydrolase [Halorubrum sp. SP9]TKX69745.1 MBL fold metallo-hydrolase [Halorubrum sp. SP9]
MELTPGVHGLPLQVSMDDREATFNATAVETPQGLLLIDAGLPDTADVLEAALDDEGLRLDDAWGVLVTHQDPDHAGCLAAVVDRTDAVVFAHETEVPYLEGDRELVKSSAERPLSIDPTTVDVRLTGGETFATAAGPMEVVATPGHSPGHVSAHFPDAELLVSADALNVVDGALVGPRPEVTQDLETAWESVETLADRAVTQTFCFHGGRVAAGTDRIRELVADR